MSNQTTQCYLPVTLKMHDLKMTDKNYGVWKMQDWKMADKLAGTRVSVLSVLTLWPLCQMAVRCVVHLLTWLCLCIFDLYLANCRIDTSRIRLI